MKTQRYTTTKPCHKTPRNGKLIKDTNAVEALSIKEVDATRGGVQTTGPVPLCAMPPDVEDTHSHRAR